MYGSYGSYSSMSSMSSPIDITPTNLRAHDAACAFPSWPRRSSLSESDREERATSFLSDDDLFLSDPFDDDSRSISGSSTCSSSAGMHSPLPLTDSQILEMQREKLALQQEYMREVLLEKECRRQAAKKNRRVAPSGSSKKSPKSKLASMTPIAEAGE